MSTEAAMNQRLQGIEKRLFTLEQAIQKISIPESGAPADDRDGLAGRLQQLESKVVAIESVLTAEPEVGAGNGAGEGA